MHNSESPSDGARNLVASKAEGLTDESLIALGREEGLLATIFGGALVDDEKAFRAQLETLHNEGRIDLLALPLADLPSLETHDFFEGQHRLTTLIPCLHGEPLAMMRLVNALVARGGEDLAANQPNGAYRKWVAAEPERARQGLELAAAGDPDAAKLLRFNLEAAGDVGQAVAIAASDRQDHRLAAITALGHMALGGDQAKAVLTALKQGLETHPDDLDAANVLTATLAIGRRGPGLSAPLVAEVIGTALALASGQTHYAIASVLNEADDDWPETLVSALMASLRDIDRTHVRTLSMLDAALADLLDGSHADFAIQLAEALIGDPERGLPPSTLRAFGRQVLRRPIDDLSGLVARWLLDDRHALRSAISAFLVSAGQRDALPFAFEGLALSAGNQILLCRRACGYFFAKPELAASVLLGVIRGGDAGVQAAASELLFDPLAMNYGGMARTYLSTVAEDDIAFASVATVLGRLAAFNAELGQAAFLRELEPSASRRQMEHDRHASTMRQAFKQAERQSVLLSLVSRATLLHGRGSLSYFRGPGDTADHSTVTELQSHGYEVEFPRMEVWDPVGLALQLRELKFGVLRP